jgi:hypothetical protein
MSLAFFPRSRVTTTSGAGEEHARNLPVPPTRSLRAGRAGNVPEGEEGEGNASEEEEAMAAWSFVGGRLGEKKTGRHAWIWLGWVYSRSVSLGVYSGPFGLSG